MWIYIFYCCSIRFILTFNYSVIHLIEMFVTFLYLAFWNNVFSNWSYELLAHIFFVKLWRHRYCAVNKNYTKCKLYLLFWHFLFTFNLTNIIIHLFSRKLFNVSVSNFFSYWPKEFCTQELQAVSSLNLCCYRNYNVSNLLFNG